MVPDKKKELSLESRASTQYLCWGMDLVLLLVGLKSFGETVE